MVLSLPPPSRRVLPYCIVNAAFALFPFYTDTWIEDIFKLNGHDDAITFMTIMISYLVVTRINVALNRYVSSRRKLSDLISASKEIIHYSVAFTRFKQYSTASLWWRMGIAKRVISIFSFIFYVIGKREASHIYTLEEN